MVEHSPLLIMSVGCPGSGKSTFFSQLRAKSYPDALYFSMDDMREWIKEGPYYILQKEKEKEVLARYKLLVFTAFKTQKDIILDRTHLTPDHRAPYIEQARLYGYKIKIYFFHRSLNTCLRQNKLRVRRCPEQHIINCFQQLIPPTMEEADGLVKFFDKSILGKTQNG